MNNGRKTLELLEAQGETSYNNFIHMRVWLGKITWNSVVKGNALTTSVLSKQNKQFCFLVESPSLYLVMK